MRNLLTILSLIVFVSFSYGQNTQKTLVKTFNLKGSKAVVLDTKSSVEVKEWSNETMRIQMSITLENANTHMLKYLITKGRYNLSTELTDDGLVVSFPGRKKDVVVNKNGDKLKEVVTYTVFVPSDVTAKTLTELTGVVETDTDSKTK